MSRATRGFLLPTLVAAALVSAATTLPARADTLSPVLAGSHPACRAGQLSISIPQGPAADGPDAAMGTLTWNIVFRNRSTATCSLSGWPAISAGYRGKPVDLKVSDTRGNHLAAVPSRTVVLAEGASAVTTVMTSDAALPGCTAPWTLDVRLPHTTGSEALRQPADSFGPCGGGQLGLSPVYPLSMLLGTLHADHATPSTSARKPVACNLARISITAQSAPGTVGLIRLRNTDPAACSLPTYWPTVRLHEAGGSAEMAKDFAAPAAIAAVRSSLAPYRLPSESQSLTLQPAATASIAFASAATSAGPCAKITSASLYSTVIAQGASRTVKLGNPVTICGHPQLLPYLAGTPAAAELRTVQAAGAGQKPQVSPDNDGPAGFWYGTDSNGPTAVGSGPYYEPDPDVSSDENGRYGWYGGDVGSYAHWYGCTSNPYYPLDWNQTDYYDAQRNYNTYGDGIGASAYWQMAGPGRDPSYNGTSSEAFDWGEAQANRVIGADLSDDFSAPYVIMDIEDAGYNGWNGVWNSPCGSDEESTSVSSTLDRETFNGFWDTIVDDSGYEPAVYCAGGSGGSSWNAIFGSSNNITGTPEWTYVNETGSLSSYPDGWSVDGVSAVFFGGQTTSSDNADFWQWSGGDGILNYYPGTSENVGDFDQVDGNNTLG